MQRKPLAATITPLIQRQAVMPEDEETLQTKTASPRTPQVTPKISANINAMRGNGQPLPASARAFFEPRFGVDFSGVRVHTNGREAETARAVNARAFTVGSDVTFGGGQYAPESSEGKKLLAHELTHVVQQATGSANGIAPSALQRREVSRDNEIQGPQDWTTADREGNKTRWKNVCLTNLNAVDSSQYVRIVERRDFYHWFYEYTAARGYTTRWALAANLVANGAHQIADMDEQHALANDTFALAGVELQGAMREGNQVIFDNVLPKLKRLLYGGPLTGPAALRWDMQVLAEEQSLIQPMYGRMSSETVDQLNYIARQQRIAGLGAWWTGESQVPAGPYNNPGTVPAFNQPDILNVGNRWRYGMDLGNQFTPGGTGFDPSRHAMPAVSAGYSGGSELARVDTRANLHALDAWLNPNRYTRMGPGSTSAITYLEGIIGRLTAFEKQQVLADRNADGWAYSIQFAQFGAITEALVRRALPSSPPAAVAAFLARYNAERNRVEIAYPTPNPYGMGF